jgi:hypothetical protein
LSRCIEAYSYATYTKLRALSKTGVVPGSKIYEKVKEDDKADLQQFKEKIIASIVAVHPERFKTLITFSDWNGAMNYLEENRQVALLFLMEGEDLDR